MENSQRRGIENAFPFLVSGITGILSYYLTLKYLDKQYGILWTAVIAFVLVAAITRINLWAFFGALLVGFVVEGYEAGQLEEIRLVGVVFVAGTLLNLLVEYWKGRLTSYEYELSLSVHILLAFLGTGIGFFLMQYVYSNLVLSSDDVLLMFCGYYFLTPLFWTPFITILPKTGFDLRNIFSGLVRTTVIPVILLVVFTVVVTLLQIPLSILGFVDYNDPVYFNVVMSTIFYLCFVVTAGIVASSN